MASHFRQFGAILPLASAAILACGLNSASAETIDWKTVGDWDISFYPNSEGCQAFEIFDDNTAFFIGFDNTDNVLALDITLLDERWTSIESGKEYSIELKFGNESPWTLEMDGLNVDNYPGLNIMIDAKSDEADLFIDEFQRESKMAWSFGGTSLGSFALRGSRAAFNEVIACQKSYFEALNTPSDPFAASNGSNKKKDPFAD